ncbi:MAG: FAD-binding protein [Deltaproteobacteria bacterium]|nr:MAG: FAD-binding protein [Deltaproteobacteria bacterium]
MFGRKKPEVLVVGAGPVGLVAALTLARRGVRVQIIDEAWRPTAHAYALALHPRSLALLADMGIAGPVIDAAYRVDGIGLYTGAERRAKLDLAQVGGDHPYVAVMSQSGLEGLLTEALAEHKVKVDWNHRLARIKSHEDHVAVSVDKLEKDTTGYAVTHSSWVVGSGHDFDVPFVIGADGHRSLVRRQLQMEFPEVGKPQHFAVFEFATDFDFGRELRIMLNESDANVVWPLPDGHCRFSFELPGYDDPKDVRRKDRHMFDLGGVRYPQLEESNLLQLLKQRVPWFDGSVGDIRWRLVVRFERRLVKTFGAERVWLAGDAGHMTSPVGIQSMNVGIQEAHALATAMADTLQGSASSDALAAYDKGRLAEWRGLMGLEKKLKRVTAETPEWVTPFANELVMGLPASGSELTALAAQVGVVA